MTAPERIWGRPSAMSDATDESGWVYGEWDRSQLAQHTIEEKAEYVRADLYSTLAAKCEALERERGVQQAGLNAMSARLWELTSESEALAAKCEALERERDELRRSFDATWAVDVPFHSERAFVAEARVRSLEDALRKIAGYDGRFNYPFPEGHPDYPAFAIVTAREALSDTPREEGKT